MTTAFEGPHGSIADTAVVGGVLAVSNVKLDQSKPPRKPLADRVYTGRIAKAKYEFVRIDEVERKVKEALLGTLGPDCARVVMKKMSTAFEVPIFDARDGIDNANATRKLHHFVARWRPSKAAVVKLALGALAHADELLDDGRPLLIKGAGSMEKLCTRRITDWLIAKDEVGQSNELTLAQRDSLTNKRLAIASSVNDALKFVRLRACELKGDGDGVIEGHTTDQALAGWKATRGSGLVYDSDGKMFVVRAMEEASERCA